MTWETNHLAHFGIFGMKWGVRRFQNQDGTLTEAGKARYRKSDVDKEFNSILENNKQKVSRIQDNAKKIREMAEDLSGKYSTALDKMSRKLPKKVEDNIWNELHKKFGDKCENEAEFDMAALFIGQDEIERNLPKKLTEQKKAFIELQDQYWKDVKELTSDFESKYKNSKVEGLNDEVDVHNYVTNLIDKNLDTFITSRLFRLSDSYFLGDDPWWNAIDYALWDFTIDEYNKRYSK